MKLWIKILFIVLVILAIIYTAAHILIIFKGKSLIETKLEELTKRKVGIKNLDLKPSFSLEVRGLDIRGLAKIDSLFISPSILGLLTGNIALNDIRIIKPEITYERALPETTELSTTSSSETTKAYIKRRPLRLILKRIIIKDGTLNFFDNTVGKDGLKITVTDLNFYLDNLMLLPKSVITDFKLTGKIPWQKQTQKEGEIAASGWINLFKRDMQAHLEIKNIEGVYFHPYYANWVDLEKSRIQEATLQFRSDITGHNNDVVADCHLELTDLVFRPKAEGEEEDKAYKIAAAVLDIFKALDKGIISLNFAIRTKMDSPEFGFDNIRMAFEDKIALGAKSDKVNPQDLMKLPVELLNGAIKGATDITNTLIKSTVEVGKTIKDAVVDTFKSNKKK